MNSTTDKPIFKGHRELVEKPKQLNFNTVVSAIVLGAVVWVGNSIKDGTEKLSKIDNRMSVMEALNSDKIERLIRIEAELSRQRDSLRDLQIDVTRIKNNPTKP
jgi:predicted component of type VI protein secretion system